MNSAAPIDRNHLSRYTLGDASLEAEILSLFVGQMPHTLEQLSAVASAKEWAEAAHALKGSARAVGAWALAEIAEQAEKSKSDRTTRQNLVARIEVAAAEVCAFVDDFQVQHSCGPAAQSSNA